MPVIIYYNVYTRASASFAEIGSLAQMPASMMIPGNHGAQCW